MDREASRSREGAEAHVQALAANNALCVEFDAAWKAGGSPRIEDFLSRASAACRPAMFFTEVDGDARVWVNGREVGASEKKCTPFSVDAGGACKQGRNAVALRVDHTNITDLCLAGILRPVLLIDRGS